MPGAVARDGDAGAQVRLRRLSIEEPRSVRDVPALNIVQHQQIGETLAPYTQHESDVYVYQRCWAARPLARKGHHLWRTMFETAGLPSSWVCASELYDQVWVPTSFNLGTFERAGVSASRLRKLPSIVPTWAARLSGSDGARSTLRRDGVGRYTCLAVGKTEERKGFDALVSAWRLAGLGADRAQLVIKSGHFNASASVTAQALKRSVRSAIDDGFDIKLIGSEVPRSKMTQIYVAADCFVAPSRGEGWGRPAMEGLLAGLRLIATGWGGTLEYATPIGADLISFDIRPCSEQAISEWSYFDGQAWAEPSVEDLARLMDEAAAAGVHAIDRDRVRRYLYDKFGVEAVSATIGRLLSKLF